MDTQDTQKQLPPPAGKEKSPVAKHRQQMLWQVWVPLGVSILLVIGLAVWSALTTANNAVLGSQWADLSLIFMIMPTALMCLVFMALLFLMVYLFGKVNTKLPILALRVQTVVYQVQAKIITFANALVKPVMAVNGATASWRNFKAHFRRSRVS